MDVARIVKWCVYARDEDDKEKNGILPCGDAEVREAAGQLKVEWLFSEEGTGFQDGK